jgi:hypothetical protein
LRINFEAARETNSPDADPFLKFYVNTSSEDLYVLQEQISEYLDVKSFKRKHPDIFRRFSDVKERVFLRDFGVVNETQCDLGLNALKLVEVLDLMANEYREKYNEFSAFLNEKRRKAVTLLKQQSQAAAQSSKRSEPVNSSQRTEAMLRKAMQSVLNYNAQLAREKKEERHSCFDLQTMVRVFFQI